ncbi:hypothetical protein C8C88_1979 [Flavobacterium sp. 123]|nr:hypothetical protein C8C88_1979 [Flavobacterium sp. 123]
MSDNILNFLVPVVLIVWGIFLKISKNENYLSLKRYWLFFLLGGIFLFFARLYTALHH